MDIRNAVIKFYNMYINKIQNITSIITHIFGICKSTLYYWIHLYKLYREPLILKQGRPLNSGKITQEIENYIIHSFVVYKNKQPNSKNIQRSVKRIFNKTIKRSTIYYILNKNKVTYKKISVSKYPHSNEILNQKKKELLSNLTTNNEIISFDECFLSPENLEKEYGWSLQGTPCNRKVNGKRYKDGKSLLMAISSKKVVAYKLVKGSVNGEIVRQFIMNDVLLNKSNTIVLMDNARTHHYKELKKDVEQTTNKFVYNIPYHPKSNPIEYINNVVKNDLKKQCINNIDKIIPYLDKAINKISELTLKNCFTHAWKSLIPI